MEMSRMDDFFGLVRDDIAKTLGGKMRSETRSVIGDFPTLDVVYDANGIAFAIMRLVLTPRRAIQILIQANRSLDGNRIVERMLRSFAPLP